MFKLLKKQGIRRRLILTMVFDVSTMGSKSERMFSNTGRIISKAHTIGEIAETMFSKALRMFSKPEAIFSVSLTMFREARTIFSEAEPIFRASESSFSITEKTVGAVPTVVV